MSVSDRIVLMKKGSVVEIGTPEQLYTKPLKIFTANFIGETNLLEGWVKSVADGITRIELRDESIVEVLNATMKPGRSGGRSRCVRSSSSRSPAVCMRP